MELLIGLASVGLYTWLLAASTIAQTRVVDGREKITRIRVSQAAPILHGCNMPAGHGVCGNSKDQAYRELRQVQSLPVTGGVAGERWPIPAGGGFRRLLEDRKAVSRRPVSGIQ